MSISAAIPSPPPRPLAHARTHARTHACTHARTRARTHARTHARTIRHAAADAVSGQRPAARGAQLVTRRPLPRWALALGHAGGAPRRDDEKGTFFARGLSPGRRLTPIRVAPQATYCQWARRRPPFWRPRCHCRGAPSPVCPPGRRRLAARLAGRQRRGRRRVLLQPGGGRDAVDAPRARCRHGAAAVCPHLRRICCATAPGGGAGAACAARHRVARTGD